jgi:hypothetical protein
MVVDPPTPSPLKLPTKALLFIFMAVWATRAARAEAWPAEVERALAEAGKNRGELQEVLRHFQRGGDRQKYDAACFLIRNMPEHAYRVFLLKDPKGATVPFDALSYPDFAQARRALAQLEAKYGELDFRPDTVIRDVETVKAHYLIDDIDLAFRIWREKHWARSLSFEAFCEYVLPYRAGHEPVERWRAACEIPTGEIVAGMKDPSDPREAAATVIKQTKHQMGFSELYYLHPTDQGFAEMCRTRVGRCGDMSNLQVYIYRANGIAVASDYTPFWATRDNNHGWEVLLDKDGRGSAGLFSRAAKIYRRQFSKNPESLASQVKGGEDLPPALGSKHIRDVTEQYTPTTDVCVSLIFPPPRPTAVSYICVFNAGEWRPIHWARITDGQAVFTRMGREIVYLPAYYDKNHVVPAAPPFILNANGRMIQLAADPGDLARLSLTSKRPTSPIKTEAASERTELYLWDRGWQKLGELPDGRQGQEVFAKLPANRLYWATSAANRETARIFTVEAGKQRFW